VLSVVVLTALLTAGLAMPFVTSTQLKLVCIVTEFSIAIQALLGIFVRAFEHTPTLASDLSKLIAVLLSSAVALSWLLGFHQRQSSLVRDLEGVRSDLERRVDERTSQLKAELDHAYELESTLRAERERGLLLSEDERRRLRRELHDEFSPAIGGCVLSLETLYEKVGACGSEALDTLDRLHENLSSMRIAIRELSYRLIPEHLDLGLWVALRHLVENSQRQATDIYFELLLPSEPIELSAAIERVTYLTVQSAIQNVIQHSHARVCIVKIDLASDFTQLFGMVSDDGVGIGRETKHGVGLKSMRERLELLSGALHIENCEPSGTELSFELRLNSLTRSVGASDDKND
jgi:signal transduction histidine kinase